MNDINPKKLGNIYGFEGGSFAGNCYSKETISPAINTMQGGNRTPLIVEDFYNNRDIRVYGDYAPSIRSERNGLKVLEDDKS